MTTLLWIVAAAALCLAAALAARRIAVFLSARPRITAADLEKLAADIVPDPRALAAKSGASTREAERQTTATYTFTDSSGATRIYSSVEEMPPDVRRFFSQFGDP